MDFKQYLNEATKAQLVDGGNRLSYKEKKHKEGFGGKSARKGLKSLKSGKRLTSRQKKALKAHFENPDNLNKVSTQLGSDYVGTRIYDNQDPDTGDEQREKNRIAAVKDTKARIKHIKSNTAQRLALASKIKTTRTSQILKQYKGQKVANIKNKAGLKNSQRAELADLRRNNQLRIKRIKRESGARKKDAENVLKNTQ